MRGLWGREELKRANREVRTRIGIHGKHIDRVGEGLGEWGRAYENGVGHRRASPKKDLQSHGRRKRKPKAVRLLKTCLHLFTINLEPKKHCIA